MESTNHHANKENMARFLESEPSPKTPCAGIAERRMRALREQQRQELLMSQETSSANKSEESMDVDMDMDECGALPPKEEKAGSSSCNNVSWGTNDVDWRVKRYSKFAERFHRLEEEMDCSSVDDILPITDYVNRHEKQCTNFAEKLDQNKMYDFYVVDTCVYIDDLAGIKELLTYCLEPNNHSVLVVPYEVLQELDGLKEKKPHLLGHVVAASRFIKKNIASGHCGMIAQHMIDYMRTRVPGLSGDDNILNYALELRNQVPCVGTITLVSHDNILRTKAVAAQLGETTMNRLLEEKKPEGLSCQRLNRAVMQSFICEEFLYGYQANNNSRGNANSAGYSGGLSCAIRTEDRIRTTQTMHASGSQTKHLRSIRPPRTNNSNAQGWKAMVRASLAAPYLTGLRGQWKDTPRYSGNISAIGVGANLRDENVRRPQSSPFFCRTYAVERCPLKQRAKFD